MDSNLKKEETSKLIATKGKTLLGRGRVDKSGAWNEHTHTTICKIVTNRDLLYSTGKSESEVAQLCPTLGDPMDYTIHGILQARIM